MANTIRVEIDAEGHVRPLEPGIQLPVGHALLTILTPETVETHETALLAEKALAEDWLKEEEDAAWQHLQPGK